MEQNLSLPQPQTEQIAEKKKREYSLTEVLFAWVSMLAGYAFFRVIPITTNSFGALLYVVALFAVTAAVAVKRGARLRPVSIVAMLAAVVVSFSLFFSSNAVIHFFAYSFAAVSYCYFIYSCFDNNLEKGFSDLFAADYFKAVFVMPFASFGEVFSAIASGRSKKHGKVVLKALLGAALAVVPTAIVVSLLSYDKGFTKILNGIFKFTPGEFASHLFSALFGILVGMYIFGAYISSCDNRCTDVVTLSGCRQTAEKAKVMPAVTAVVAVLPLLALYVIFFISQWDYYVSGFVGMLPDSVSYAQYAREGFFQLCAVSAINLAVIFSLSMLMKRDKRSVVLKVLSLVLSAATLALISTAIAKMVLYINKYGLTPKRVYSSWFMLVLAVVFLLVCVRQFVPKFKLAVTVFFVTVGMFALLALSNVDSLIARYNVENFISGKLETVDVYTLENLGDSAVPSLVRLAKHLDKENGTSITEEVKNLNHYDDDYYIYEDYEESERKTYNRIVNTLSRYEINNRNNSVFSLSLPRINARAALKSIGID